MSSRNAVHATFDEFGKAAGMRKKSGSWFSRSDETVFVLNLQKSNYSTRYYVNLGVWLLALGENDFPKENKCQIRTRLTRLVPSESEARLNDLLDLDASIEDGVRTTELLTVLEEHVRPAMIAARTLAELRSKAGNTLIARSLVSGAGEQVLAGG